MIWPFGRRESRLSGVQMDIILRDNAAATRRRLGWEVESEQVKSVYEEQIKALQAEVRLLRKKLGDTHLAFKKAQRAARNFSREILHLKKMEEKGWDNPI